MYRLTLLVIALFITFYAFSQPAVAGAPTTPILRDTLIMAAVGALFFALSAPPPQGHQADAIGGRLLFGPLVLVTAGAALAHFWRLAALPPDCIDAECARALQLTEQGSAPTIFYLLGALFFRVTEQGVLSLRLAAALIGTLTVPLFYATARRWAAPGAALLATLLFAFSPWRLWASRSGDPAVIFPLLIALVIWLLPTHRPRPNLREGGRLLLAVIALAGLFYEIARLPWASDGLHFAPLLAALVGGAQPATSGLITTSALLSVLAASLILPGIGYALRWVNHLRYAGLLAVLIALSAVAALVDEAASPAASTLLLILLPLFWLGAVTLECVLAQFLQTWRSLFRPTRLFAAAFLLIAALGLRQVSQFFAHLDAVTTAGQTPALAAIGRTLAEHLRAPENAHVTFFAPTAVIDSPAVRLMAGSALTQANVQPLEAIFDVLALAAPRADWQVLAPPDAVEQMALLRQFFPGATVTSHYDKQADAAHQQPLFAEMNISAAQSAAQQGLSGNVLADGGVVRPMALDALQIDWPTAPPLVAPLTAQWQGTLLVAEAGEYDFAVAGADVGSAETYFALRLDGQPILAAPAGSLEQTIALVQGLYHIEIDFHTSTSPAPLTIRWRPPAADWAVVPASALLNSPTPVMGLAAAYYAGEHAVGAPLAQRKDLFVAAPANLPHPYPHPYTVVWQGQVAAARAGDYRFATVSDGVTQLQVDGKVVLTGPPPDENEQAAAEGLIYLSQGWHELNLIFTPANGQPPLQLLWQPAGSNERALTSTTLIPLSRGAQMTPAPLSLPPLPPAPPLSDARLGDDHFSLTQALADWQPQVRIPPLNLPALPFALGWQAGEGCGSDDRLLDQPHGVAIDWATRQILVADTANRRVAIFDLVGALVGSLRAERFEEPFDLALTPTGAPLLLDAGSQQIYRLDAEAGVVEPLALDVSFYHPRGLSVDAAGNLLVADTGGARIVILQPDGAQSGQFGGQGSVMGRGQPVDVVAAAGVFWAIAAEDGRLWQLDTGGSLTAVQPTNTLNGPHLAGLSDGSFFVTDPALGLVRYHKATGEPAGQFGSEVLVNPTGVDAGIINGVTYVAVVDSANCTLSWWQSPS